MLYVSGLETDLLSVYAIVNKRNAHCPETNHLATVVAQQIVRNMGFSLTGPLEAGGVTDMGYAHCLGIPLVF